MAMKPITLEKIAEVTGGTYTGAPELASRLITGVVRDNREVQPGNLFACIVGERADGHSFANSAFDAGAAACLAEKPIESAKGPYILVSSTLAALQELAAYYRSLFDIPFVGITGSVGKTTAKEMTASALSARYNVLRTPANLNNELGVPLTLLSLREEHEAAVIEMGISEFGEMSLLARLVRPDITVMTNIGYCHLESLGDLPGVLRAKSEVFGYMAPGSAAVLNGDDELLRAYDPGNGIEKLTFGYGEHNYCRAKNITLDGSDGVSCDVVCEGHTLHLDIPAFGSHMALGALPAVIVARRLGLKDEEIARGIASYRAVGGRANVIDTGCLRIINDCYNANPNSVSASLLSLCTLPCRRVAILGDMKELGRDSAKLHFGIGGLAAEKGVDCLICAGPEARLIGEGFAAAKTGRPVYCFEEKSELLPLLPSLIKYGDAVLVKASHSMEFGEIVSALSELGCVSL